MKKYIVKKSFYNGTSYKKDEVIKLPEEEAEELKAIGVIEVLSLDEEFLDINLSEAYSEESFRRLKTEFSKKEEEKIEKLSEEEKEKFYYMDKKARKDLLKFKE